MKFLVALMLAVVLPTLAFGAFMGFPLSPWLSVEKSIHCKGGSLWTIRDEQIYGVFNRERIVGEYQGSVWHEIEVPTSGSTPKYLFSAYRAGRYTVLVEKSFLESGRYGTVIIQDSNLDDWARQYCWK